MLEETLVNETLADLPTPCACAARDAAFFGPPGGANVGILEDVGPPSETGWAAVPDS